jgi:hypothetical protein
LFHPGGLFEQIPDSPTKGKLAYTSISVRSFDLVKALGIHPFGLLYQKHLFQVKRIPMGNPLIGDALLYTITDSPAFP